MTNKNFKIIVPFYNVEQWINKCVRSIQLQTYQDFKCFLIDDISTDSSVSIIEKLIANDDRFTLIKNTEKKYALRNIFEAIEQSGNNSEDIIVTLDGDDWLATKTVLSTLDNIYRESDCWMTYGSYIEYPSKKIGQFCREIDKNIINNNSHRENRWVSSHLRTFKRSLWERIKIEDLKQKDGKFYRMTWDQAFMFPMLEMSRHRARHIEKPLYVYNRENPINDDKVNHRLQIETEKEIRRKEKYDKINTLNCNLKGGLGNMLFQIAATISIAKDNNMEPSFYNLDNHLRFLNKDVNQFHEAFGDFNQSSLTGREKLINFPFHYENISIPKEDLLMEGFFQDQKYFINNEKEIREVFKIPKEIQQYLTKKYSFFLNKVTTSLHVRRGDYMKKPDFHPFLGKQFYDDAMKELPDTEVFVVFSDDISWCKDNFVGEKFVFISGEEDYIDLYLMSLCENNIIANSSFSWWGAWLNNNENKTVICPKIFVGNKLSHLDVSGVYPEDWKRR
jgi:glycosyltransferase involved in cell wall biosynthesis